MMASNRNFSNNSSAKTSPSPCGITLEKKEPIDGPHSQTNREMRTDGMVEKRIDEAVYETTEKSSDIKGDVNLHVYSATTTAKKSPLIKNKEQESKEYIQHWEQEALSHFRISSWEGELHGMGGGLAHGYLQCVGFIIPAISPIALLSSQSFLIHHVQQPTILLSQPLFAHNQTSYALAKRFSKFQAKWRPISMFCMR